MKVLGITAEYNPFHNGHLYHVNKAAELSGADCIVVAMSGDFVQRGEPALCSKWKRAEAAMKSSVKHGRSIDLVIELPFIFACNRAENFARGSVDMLVRSGCNCISFGCEADEPEKLSILAADIMSEKEELEAKTSDNMREGISHAKAYERALREVLGDSASRMILSPNNILAIEYIKRIAVWRNRGIEIEVLPIKRYGSGFCGVDDLGGGGYAGASALRQMLEEKEDISRYVPEPFEHEDQRAICSDFFKMLKAVVLRSTRQDIASVYCVGEGIENRIADEIRKHDDFAELVAALVSKRYSAATIKRMLTYILLGAKREEMDYMLQWEPEHALLLAASDVGRVYVRKFNGGRFRFITNINKSALEPDSRAGKVMRMDGEAADVYNLLCGRNIYRTSDNMMHPYISNG